SASERGNRESRDLLGVSKLGALAFHGGVSLLLRFVWLSRGAPRMRPPSPAVVAGSTRSAKATKDIEPEIAPTFTARVPFSCFHNSGLQARFRQSVKPTETRGSRNTGYLVVLDRSLSRG